MINAIDLFSGAGGFTCGFKRAGFNVVKALEIDPVIASTYKENNQSTNVIVDDIANADESGKFKRHEADVIIGGPPCQGFSMAGARNRNGFISDPRNFLFKHYFNVVKEVRPKVFVFENVKGLLSMQKGKIFEEIRKIFSNKDLLNGDYYNLYWGIIKADEFGIPQKRERFILIGVLNNSNINFDDLWSKTKNDISSKHPHFFDKTTIKDAIGNMPQSSENGQVIEPHPVSSYEKEIFISDDYIMKNHTSRNHSPKAIERMKRVSPGENYKALDEKISSVHSGSYGRMVWDEPSVTITTRFDTPSGGRFTHPEKNRTLTDREAARIQSFPDDYVFLGSKTSISTQIGNAVPPKLAYFLAKFVNNILEIL